MAPNARKGQTQTETWNLATRTRDIDQPPGPGKVPRQERPIKQTIKRSTHQKVKTGCQTCKVRRVKCDETRPHCLRCIKFEMKCDGYRPIKGFSMFNPTQARIGARNIQPKSLMLSQQPPISRRFDSEQERRFFQLYCEDIATQIPGSLKTTIWERIIPQMCDAEPFVRHAVVGLSALTVIYRDQHPRRGNSSHPLNHAQEFRDRNRSLYEFALMEYDKSLRMMRKAIESTTHDMRVALIACLLVFCFESIHGNPNAAVSNANSGLTLLQNFLSAKAPRCLMIENCGKPTEGIEVDILRAFAGLDLQVLFFQDTRTPKMHQVAVERLNGVVVNLPNEFHGLEESMEYWVSIQRRNYHFITLAIDSPSNSASARKRSLVETPLPADDPGRDQAFYGNVNPNSFNDTDSACNERLREHMEDYRGDIRRWARASAHVFDWMEKYGREKQKTLMKILKIHSNLNHVELTGAFMVKETEYDAFLPEYTAIVELCEEVYPYLAQKSNILFRFSLGIVYPLFAVGFRCRDPHIRERAIALLQQGPYREGILDALSAAKFTDWIRKIEEKGMNEQGYIPEHKRVTMTICNMDSTAMVAVLSGTVATEEDMNLGNNIVTGRTDRKPIWEHETRDTEVLVKLKGMNMEAHLQAHQPMESITASW